MRVASESTSKTQVAWMLQWVGKQIARYLSAPIKGYAPLTTTRSGLLAETLRPGDILLVEGNSRISSAIKYLTQSTWSHAALYVGPLPDYVETGGEMHVLVEADMVRGVITAPLSKYAVNHTRICRPISLSDAEVTTVVAYAISRIGNDYDLRNVFDLARYFLPNPPIPSRFRRRMISLGAGSPTRAVCSTLIAQAFQSVNYPILADPEIPIAKPASIDISEEAEARRQESLHIRHYSLFAPRDFDISPYFAIVKPTLDAGFDYKKVAWAARGVERRKARREDGSAPQP